MIKLAAIFGMLGVALGAFGSHGLKNWVDDARLIEVFKTGVFYHLSHTPVLLAIGIALALTDKALLPGDAAQLKRSGIAISLGIILFAGSLYAMVFFGIPQLGIITPFGGVSLILGWVFLFLAFFRQNKSE